MRYIIYVRKSTEREDRQVLSIQSQIIEMKEIAERENLNVIEILQESKSAKDPGRPIFNSMVEKFKKGEADGILCWKIDRLARNPVDEGIIKWYLQKNIIKQIKTFDRDYDPEDNVVIASIEFSMANQYIRDLSKNVKRGIAQKIRRGEYPASPPIGYLIDDKTKRLLIDKKKWQYIKNAFKLYATGLYSIKQLEGKLYKDGFRSPTGNLFYAGSIHRMLKNPIYYGWFAWKGQIHKGVHPPIISKNLFDQVQDVLFPRKHLKRDNKLEFTFRGFM
ncbi:recombinase family protein, partial [Candidatus Parcubacteria bacterium]|nr:recombinase family protein [Candidatus Parcubacteria bacterium]